MRRPTLCAFTIQIAALRLEIKTIVPTSLKLINTFSFSSNRTQTEMQKRQALVLRGLWSYVKGHRDVLDLATSPRDIVAMHNIRQS